MFCWIVPYFFLRIKIVASAIAMIIATVDAAKYISVGGWAATGIGEAVGAVAPITANDVSACDG